MKKTLTALFTAALVAAGCSGNKAGGPVIFEGRFIGYNGEYVEFFLPVGDGTFKEMPIRVAEDGTFCDTLEFEKADYDAALFADRFMFRTSIEPGKHYIAEFDLTEEGVETNFRFTGEGEKENSFLARYWETFTYADSVIDANADCASFNEFIGNIRSISEGLLQDLATVGNKPFEKYYRKDIARNESMYAAIYPILQINRDGEYLQDSNFTDYMSKHVLDEQTISVISSIAAYSYGRINLAELLKSAPDICGESGSRIFIEKLLTDFVGAGSTFRLKPAFDYYCELYDDPDEELVEKCNNALTLCPGAIAPDIECLDIDGNVHHLSEFAGKPLYIDLWASWCGPCCAEIPHLARLVESLGPDPEIVCISISIDEEKESWSGKLESDKPFWPQFIASEAGQESISKVYGVTGIPRFMLVAADGTIASVNAPRPSDPDIVNSLKSLL
ncbi:MAG: TlpA family protein disulfide reductase [Bacteroidales bacterium]|nr:TlpA family protein disulfide reductase [Bacteroidales bacterium]